MKVTAAALSSVLWWSTSTSTSTSWSRPAGVIAFTTTTTPTITNRSSPRQTSRTLFTVDRARTTSIAPVPSGVLLHSYLDGLGDHESSTNNSREPINDSAAAAAAAATNNNNTKNEYVTAIAEACSTSTSTSTSTVFQAATVLASYFEALSKGSMESRTASPTVALLLSSYLDDLSLSAPTTPSTTILPTTATDGAVTAYLHALSSGAIQAPAPKLFHSYLAAIISGEVTVPQSALSITTYLSIRSVELQIAENNSNTTSSNSGTILGGTSSYIESLNEGCNGELSSTVQCGAAITNYLDALSTGAEKPSDAPTATITSYVDTMAAATTTTTTSNRKDATNEQPSGSSGAGVASYLDSVSSGQLAAPSPNAVTSYLDAMSSGAVAQPISGAGIATYLDSVSGGSTALAGGSIRGDSAYLEALSESCNPASPESECASAITNYLDALSIGSEKPSLAPAVAITSYMDALAPDEEKNESSSSGTAVTSYLDLLSTGVVTSPSPNAVTSYLGSLATKQIAPPLSAASMDSYLTLLSAGSHSVPSNEKKLPEADYIDSISVECNGSTPSPDCVTAITSYLDALSTGKTQVSPAPTAAITSYLDALSSGTAEQLPSSGAAVMSYLDALSTGVVAAPSPKAMTTYLDALSSGEVTAPSSGVAITSFFDRPSTKLRAATITSNQNKVATPKQKALLKQLNILDPSQRTTASNQVLDPARNATPKQKELLKRLADSRVNATPEEQKLLKRLADARVNVTPEEQELPKRLADRNRNATPKQKELLERLSDPNANAIPNQQEILKRLADSSATATPQQNMTPKQKELLKQLSGSNVNAIPRQKEPSQGLAKSPTKAASKSHLGDIGKEVNLLLQVAAKTGRGKSATKEQKDEAELIIQDIESNNPTSRPTDSNTSGLLMKGRWELLYSSTHLFRSSPFFLSGGALLDKPEQASTYGTIYDMYAAALTISGVGAVRQIVDGNNRMIHEFELKVGDVPFLSGSGGLPTTIEGAIVVYANIVSTKDGKAWEITLDGVEIKGSNVPLLRQVLDAGVFLASRELLNLVKENIATFTTPKPMFQTTYLSNSIRVSRDENGNSYVFGKVSNSAEATDYA